MTPIWYLNANDDDLYLLKVLCFIYQQNYLNVLLFLMLAKYNKHTKNFWHLEWIMDFWMELIWAIIVYLITICI